MSRTEFNVDSLIKIHRKKERRRNAVNVAFFNSFMIACTPVLGHRLLGIRLKIPLWAEEWGSFMHQYADQASPIVIPRK